MCRFGASSNIMLEKYKKQHNRDIIPSLKQLFSLLSLTYCILAKVFRITNFIQYDNL